MSWATASSITGLYNKVQAPDAPLVVSREEGDVGPFGGTGGVDLLDENRIVFYVFDDGETNASRRDGLYGLRL